MTSFAQNLVIFGLSPMAGVIDAYGGQTRVLKRNPVVWIEPVKGSPQARQLVFGTLHDMPWGLPPPDRCTCNGFSGWHSRPQKAAVCKYVNWKCSYCSATVRLSRPTWVQVADKDCANMWVHPVPCPAVYQIPWTLLLSIQIYNNCYIYLSIAFRCTIVSSRYINQIPIDT